MGLTGRPALGQFLPDKPSDRDQFVDLGGSALRDGSTTAAPEIAVRRAEGDAPVRIGIPQAAPEAAGAGTSAATAAGPATSTGTGATSTGTTSTGTGTGTTPAAPPPPPSAGEALAICPAPPRPTIGHDPYVRGLTGLETRLWAGPAQPLSASSTIRGYAVTCTVTPQRWVFDFGDGPTGSATKGGGPFPAHAAEHTYEIKGDYSLGVRVTWQRTTNFGTDALTTQASKPYHVIEVRGVLVCGEECPTR